MSYKKIFLSSLIISSISPTFFAISCGSSAKQTNNYIQEKLDLIQFLNDNPDAISPLDEKPTINNFVNLQGWKNLDDLLSVNFIGKYFKTNENFKNFLNEKGIYKKIRRVSIQPQVNSKTLTIIFYLDSSLNDKDIVTKEITEALNTNFAYANEINVKAIINTIPYPKVEDFTKDWNKITAKEIDLAVLKTMLKNAFDFEDIELEKIVTKDFTKNFKISKNSNYQISLKIDQEGINQGFIFHNLKDDVLSYDVLITSNPLVK